jgi:hypothetical protein
MRTLTAGCLALVGLALVPVTASAQRPKLRIDSVKMGFLSNPQTGEFKSGAWTPVYVTLTAPPDGLVEATLSVETSDSDDVRNSYSVPIRALDPNETATVVTYTRPGSAHGDLTVKVKLGSYLPYEARDNYAAMPLGNVLYVVVGERLPGFRRALANENKQANRNVVGGEEDEDPFSRDTGPRRLAFIDDIRQLPTRWFAYEGVDILFLTTGNRDFVTALLNDQENRKEAIAEWVRRGGRLVISTGRNLDMLANLGPLTALLPADVAGKVELPRVKVLESYAQTNAPSAFAHPRPRSNPNAPPPPVEVARLVPKPSRLAQASLRERDDLPMMVRGTYGLGRVTLLAFDLDQPPFTTWGNQSMFWQKFRREQGREPGRDETAMQGNVMMGMPQTNDDIASKLQQSLEEFEDVQVISFGWVALFILVYILIVGPLDYLFLKKVVKRLELTWITFPTVVIAISVAAYFTAYYLKGNDQRINKVDLVDFDLHNQAALGNTWFTIFSPRIQHYTIGVEPVAPDWAAVKSDPSRDASVVVTWMGRPEVGFGGTGRAGSQSLFRRTYEYEPAATGLRGVPIQVWTTKSFTASWETPFDPAHPLFQADLSFPEKRPDLLTGTVTSHLPVPLEDVYLYQNRGEGGRWYALDRLEPNDPRRVDGVIKGNGIDSPQWFKVAQNAPVRPNQPPRRSPGGGAEPLPVLMKRVMFLEAEQGSQRRNTSPLRALDETWRLRNQDELILVGRVAHQEGLAEDVTQQPGTATRLWLGSLPGPGSTRQAVPGTMTQETYVRVFIPVRTVSVKKD